MIRPESYRQPPSLTSVRHASRWLTDSNERPAIRLRLSNVALPPGRRLARMVTLKKRREEAESLTRAAFTAYAATDHMAASSLPTAVELTHTPSRKLTHTPSYIHGHAGSANPAKGNLHERRIWPKP